MSEPDSVEFLATEMGRAQFRDDRLRARLASMVTRLATDPSKSFPEAFAGSDAELEGAYRFFANPRVTPDAILSSHFDGTRGRVADQPTVLVVHDSTTCDFDPDGAREGLGRVRAKGQAFFAHASLVLSDDGARRPLGIIGLTTWVRGDEPSRNEKARWGQSVELAAERLGGPANLVHVMDREADDYALFHRLVAGHHRFIIRLAQDRLLMESTRREPRKISDAVAHIECAVDRHAKLSKRIADARPPKQKAIHPSRKARVARLAIGATSLSLKRPETQEKTLADSLSLHVVRVWEPDPPQGEEPIEWLLLTNEPVDSVDALLRIVDRYRARWTIEEYFKALKTGCAYRERQLADYEGLVNALAVFAPIACRLLGLRSLAQHDPDSPATRVLDPVELDVLRTFGKKPLPAAPTTRDVLLAVAALGGHIKWSGEPGWLTISRGFTELQTLTRGWCAARNIQSACDQR